MRTNVAAAGRTSPPLCAPEAGCAEHYGPVPFLRGLASSDQITIDGGEGFLGRGDQYEPIRGEAVYELPWICEFDFGLLKDVPGVVERRFGAEEILLRQGSPNEYIFYVDAGRVRLSVFGFSGREKTVSIVTKGNIFGEVSAFSGLPSPIEAVAITDTEVHGVHRAAILKDDRLLYGLLLHSIRVNYLNLWETQSLVFDDAYTRMAACLSRLCFKYGQGKGNVVRIPMRFTHEQMAALLGVSRVTVTNMFAKMKHDGLIDVCNGFVTVLDPDKLASSGRVELEGATR